MTDNDDDYEIGYATPPRSTRFQKGEPSANPSGRPRKRPSLRSELEAELDSRTTVKEGGRSVEMTKRRAIIKELVKAAIEGNQRAIAAVFSFCAKSPEDNDSDITPEEIEILETYANKKSSGIEK